MKQVKRWRTPLHWDIWVNDGLESLAFSGGEGRYTVHFVIVKMYSSLDYNNNVDPNNINDNNVDINVIINVVNIN